MVKFILFSAVGQWFIQCENLFVCFGIKNSHAYRGCEKITEVENRFCFSYSETKVKIKN